jgi:glycosyltransferase involved in cell wall biosynthesis
MTDHLRVVHVGPLTARGGIAAVGNALIQNVSPRVESRVIPTSDFLDSGPLRKVGQLARAITLLSGELRAPASIFHVHVSKGASLFRKLLLCHRILAARRVYIAHLHSAALLQNARRHYLTRLALRRLIEGAEAVVVPLHIWKASVNELAPHAKVVVIPNPVAAINRTVRTPSSDCTFGYYGSILQSKGVFELIEAFGALHDSVVRSRLLIAGAGREKELRRLHRATSRFRDGAVQYKGWLNEEQRATFLAGVDAFVQFSTTEWFGLSCIEARMAGCRVVVSDLDSVREALGSDSGVIYVNKSEGRPALLSAMKSVLVAEHEPLAAAYPQYGPSTVARRFEELYATLWNSS